MSLNIVEASISQLQEALSSGAITSVGLVAKYLQRISVYDCRGPCLNSIPILNLDVFEEAAASDARRAAGESRGPLEGIPYTIKDSMMYKGMTCENASPAIAGLVAKEDSFVAAQLRHAGCVCIGRTNTPPFMASGMHRGLHGRAESPYNLDYLTAAFSSGSSNGSATSTAASFAAFGIGSETVSSGRSPASNNALVAYTPSRTVISPRGIWPLYPTCDVVVPHTRSMEDMLIVANVLCERDSTTDGDFWRQQSFVKVPEVPNFALSLDLKADLKPFQGKRIAVPNMYINELDPAAKPTACHPDVLTLWQRAERDLQTLGAEVIHTDFPLVSNYEDDSISGHTNNVVGFPPDWNSIERGTLVAYTWDDFLLANNDPAYPSLANIDGKAMFPRPEGYIPDKYMERKNFLDYPSLPAMAASRPKDKTIFDIEGMPTALQALEAQRKRDLEAWMAAREIDAVVFPAAGDVGKADLDTNDESAKEALRNGVKYSHGNRALRHMGVPTVTVPMGVMDSKAMPVGLTFAAGHGSDAMLMEMGGAFERATRRRVVPPVTPALASDGIDLAESGQAIGTEQSATPAPEILIATANRVGESTIRVTGTLSMGAPDEEVPSVTAFVQGSRKPIAVYHSSEFSLEAEFKHFEPQKPLYGGVGRVVGNVIVVILARAKGGRLAGKLVMVDQKSELQPKGEKRKREDEI